MVKPLYNIKKQMDVINLLIHSNEQGYKRRDFEFQLTYDASNNMWDFTYYGYVSYKFTIQNEDVNRLLDSVKDELHKVIKMIKSRNT